MRATHALDDAGGLVGVFAAEPSGLVGERRFGEVGQVCGLVGQLDQAGARWGVGGTFHL